MPGPAVDYAYKEVSRAEAVAICRQLHGEGRSWHIHALAPVCRFNHRPGWHCFVVEDTGSGETWCAFSDHHFRDECHELVQLLHGKDILDAGARPDDFVEPDILKSARACAKAGEAWHHHMMKPGCVLSPAPEDHVITLERVSSKEIEVHRSPSAPDDLQREIELLYFASARKG